MVNPQKENGYTPIANEILEALVKYNFPPKTGIPMRLILFVIRKTYGFHKKEDIISLSQFQQAINEKNRSNLIYWLNYLVQAKILVKTKISSMQIKYGFNKNYEQWLPLVQVRELVQTRLYTSANKRTKTSANNRTHKRKKEIYTKENTIVATSVADYLKKMKSSKDKRMPIIALYAEFKRVEWDNLDQARSFVRRYLRSATLLKGYKLEKIQEIMQFLENTADFKWTLESVAKYIDEPNLDKYDKRSEQEKIKELLNK